MSVVSSFSGLGTAARSIELLEEQGVKRSDLQRAVVDDPIQRQRVVAVILNQDAPTDVSFDQILEREVNTLTTLCGEDWMQFGAENVAVALEQQIEVALRKVEETWGFVTVHDRVVPNGLKLDRIFRGIYAYNAQHAEAPIELGHDMDKEWWRADKSVQHIPTRFGIIRQDLTKVLQPTDIAGRPFYLSLDDQIVWSKSQGGDGLTTAEETMYMWLRSLYERNLPLWGAGSCRTANTYGSSWSFRVHFGAGGGLDVSDCAHDPSWRFGALARKFLVVG
jgi:hypothetical protein